MIIAGLVAQDFFLIIFLTLIGAVGAFIIATNPFASKNLLTQGQSMTTNVEEKPSFLSIDNLELMLHQAELDVSALAYLRVGL